MQTLYIPSPRSFKGLFQIWAETSSRKVSYNSCFYPQKDVLGPELQPRYGKSYLGIWSAVERAKRENSQMKEAFADYRESYYLFKGMYRLTSGWDPDACRERLELDGIFDPESPEQLYSLSCLTDGVCGEAAEEKSGCPD